MNPEAAQFDIDSDIRWLSSKTIRPATRSFQVYYYGHARLHSIAPSLFTLNQTLPSHVVAISIHCSLLTRQRRCEATLHSTLAQAQKENRTIGTSLSVSCPLPRRACGALILHLRNSEHLGTSLSDSLIVPRLPVTRATRFPTSPATEQGAPQSINIRTSCILAT